MTEINKDSLQKLADAYLHFLLWQDEVEINKYLSLNFLRRLKVTRQIKLIKQLPKFIFGFGIEACLLDDYRSVQMGPATVISPFQFEITQSLHKIFIESEKTTITLHSVVLEDGEWKFDAIVTQADMRVLQNLVNKMNGKKVRHV